MGVACFTAETKLPIPLRIAGCCAFYASPLMLVVAAPKTGKDMLEEGKVKMRVFVTCIKEEGLDRFAARIVRNAAKGIVYHREGVFSDYDLKSEADVLTLLRTGSL